MTIADMLLELGYLTAAERDQAISTRNGAKTVPLSLVVLRLGLTTHAAVAEALQRLKESNPREYARECFGQACMAADAAKSSALRLARTASEPRGRPTVVGSSAASDAPDLTD